MTTKQRQIKVYQAIMWTRTRHHIDDAEDIIDDVLGSIPVALVPAQEVAHG